MDMLTCFHMITYLRFCFWPFVVTVNRILDDATEESLFDSYLFVRHDTYFRGRRSEPEGAIFRANATLHPLLPHVQGGTLALQQEVI